MKIFEETGVEVKKSWSLKLTDAVWTIKLAAVDSITGVHISTLLWFKENGDIQHVTGCRNKMIVNGYDPYEHNNKFNYNGAII